MFLLSFSHSRVSFFHTLFRPYLSGEARVTVAFPRLLLSLYKNGTSLRSFFSPSSPLTPSTTSGCSCSFSSPLLLFPKKNATSVSSSVRFLSLFYFYLFILKLLYSCFSFLLVFPAPTLNQSGRCARSTLLSSLQILRFFPLWRYTIVFGQIPPCVKIFLS